MRERLDLDNIKSDYEQRKLSLLPRVINEGDFYRIAKYSNQSERMRLLAVGRIKKQRHLMFLAFFSDTVIKLAAISRLNSIFVLNLIAMTERDYRICCAAFDRIVNLKILKMNPI